MKLQTTTIFDIPFSSMTMEETIIYITKQLHNRQDVFHIVTANPEIVMYTKRDLRFKKAVKKADLITPDGVGLIKASKLLGKPIAERVTGFDMMNNWFTHLSEQGTNVSVFLLGAGPHVAEKAGRTITAKYPNIKLAGCHHGYFKKEDTVQIVEQIREAKPDILLVALGFPRQEFFIQTYKDQLHAKVAVGVGGSFDVWAGEVQRAPKWIRRINLEWFYRLCMEPSRFHRQLVLIDFVKDVFREWRSIKAKKTSSNL
ncbi:WecB/TagA/CpsF family glycosyltransferase [Ectobacillus funiculus]|uniref:WecB/TagA/CpsF family glycosyltransferase n=1 Tax=Ectobacillus funiculus TaxID=137993 RepID=UPI00397CC2AA